LSSRSRDWLFAGRFGIIADNSPVRVSRRLHSRKKGYIKMVKTLSAAMVAASLSAHAFDMDFFEQLVAIPSVSANVKEVNRATDFVKDYLVKRGVHCTVEKMDDGREVLYAGVTPGKRHDFVFSVHLDVVAPGKPSHFTVERNGDRAEGRGTGDCKGNAVAVIEMLCGLVGKNVSVGCMFGPDEEIGGLATRWMIDEKGYVPRKMVIVCDGGYGKFYYAHKGQTYVRIRAKGRSAKAICALLDMDALRQQEDQTKAIEDAVAMLKKTSGYLFEGEAAPYYAHHTGVWQGAQEKAPTTLAGALKEKFERK
jgi:acetylornithine deacetylase/succinyl-diaminopimelate desuccinylase-like protein